MFYFLRRDDKLAFQRTFGLVLLLAAIVPGVVAGLILLLHTGAVALSGDSSPGGTVVFIDAFSQSASQLWAIVFLLAVIGYGVGHQLISQTARHSLIAPLAVLAARLGRWLERGILNLSSLPATASPGNESPRRCGPTLRVRPPPVALLAGSAPLLE